jgi:hypothetical protein
MDRTATTHGSAACQLCQTHKLTMPAGSVDTTLCTPQASTLHQAIGFSSNVMHLAISALQPSCQAHAAVGKHKMCSCCRTLTEAPGDKRAAHKPNHCSDHKATHMQIFVISSLRLPPNKCNARQTSSTSAAAMLQKAPALAHAHAQKRSTIKSSSTTEVDLMLFSAPTNTNTWVVRCCNARACLWQLQRSQNNNSTQHTQCTHRQCTVRQCTLTQRPACALALSTCTQASMRIDSPRKTRQQQSRHQSVTHCSHHTLPYVR